MESHLEVPREAQAAVRPARGRGRRGLEGVRRLQAEEPLRQEVHGHRAHDVHHRPHRADRPDLPQGEGRRARRRTCSGSSARTDARGARRPRRRRAPPAGPRARPRSWTPARSSPSPSSRSPTSCCSPASTAAAARLRAALPHHGARRALGRAHARDRHAQAGLGARLPRQPRVPPARLPRRASRRSSGCRTTATTCALRGLCACASGAWRASSRTAPARVSVLPQAPYDEDDPLVQIERHALLAAWSRGDVRRWRSRARVPGGAGGYDALVSAACMALPASADEKLACWRWTA